MTQTPAPAGAQMKSSSFQFFARAWTTIVNLLSVHQRLKLFESFIPQDQPPIKEALSGAAAS